MYTPEEIKKAKKKVKAKKEFYQHLMTFVIVNSFLIVLNLVTSPTSLWFYFPLMGWGLGLLFHYVEVFGIPGFDILNQEWEERELYNELNKQVRRPVSQNPNVLLEDKDDSLELKETRKDYDSSELV